MGEFVADEDGTVMAAPSSTDSPHSSPSSSIIPPVSSTFLYNSMMSATHSVSPQPPCLLNEEEELEEEDMCPSYRSGETRKAREFIPESKKDEKYWERRRKNNEAAKRSREKRRQNDALMEQEIAELKHQNEALMRDNAALLREVAALKARHKVDAADPVALAQPTPPPPPPLAPTLNTLDLLALQRLLSALASNNGTGVLDQGKTRAGGGLDESPLDLSGGKPSLLQHQCLVQPSPPNPTLPVEEMEQIGRLTELAVLTSTSPQTCFDGVYTSRQQQQQQQSCSWANTPKPTTPIAATAVSPGCNGLQALISAAALTASPLLADSGASDSRTTASWDAHQMSPCLPLGLQPPPQQSLELPSDPPKRRSGVIRSPSAQFNDERYRERRRKNNEAVRRCRENKRARLSMSDEVTGRLQSDNILLRSKLDGLNSEVRALRHLLLAGQQSQAQMAGSQSLKENPPETPKAPPQTAEDTCAPLPSPPPAQSPTKPLPKYALPKKGIPRVPSHLPPLKRRITLPPTFNPLAGGGTTLVPLEGGATTTN
uniref:BZIP domain-containing protein n=1 Tax=Mesocestoides corti TaxID=53468 RepID=A0A5K3EI46_MESCO